MFGKGKEMTNPTNWVLKQRDEQHVTDSFEVLRGWFRDNKVFPDSRIFNPISNKWYRPEEVVPAIVAPFPATTGVNIDGYAVEQYLDIDSVEIVIGTGPVSEFFGEVNDFFGERSTGFERKMQSARVSAVQKLKLNALRRGADALIGVDLDYTEFSQNRVAVVASGTLVKLKRLAELS